MEDARRLAGILAHVPSGVGVYELKEKSFYPVYHNPAFFKVMGCTDRDIPALKEGRSLLRILGEDLPQLQDQITKLYEQGAPLVQLCRIFNELAGEYRWIRVEAALQRQPDGTPLFYMTFSDVSGQMRLAEELTAANEKIKEAQMETAHLVNSIPGGIASYRVVGTRFIPMFSSDGVMALSGHTREEYRRLCGDDAMNIVYETDRPRVLSAALEALRSGEALDLSYRIRHKDGRLVWIHLNGRRMGPVSDHTRFYAVFTRMASETQMLRDITRETADGIYIIDRENYDLLYVVDFKNIFNRTVHPVGQKCYKALYGNEAPCTFCTLKKDVRAEEEQRQMSPDSDRVFKTHFREIDWNGIPAYIKYVRDVTKEIKNQEERERLEQYFQMMVKNLPGGVAVVRCEQDGRIVPEFMSEGFAEMTGMTLEEAWQLYENDAMAGVCPKDRARVEAQMDHSMGRDKTNNHCEIVYRLMKGDGGYVWVKNTLSLIKSDSGVRRIYAVYHDMTKEIEEQENLRRQYNELIIRHYRMPGPNAVIAGHCNITQGNILEINDYTQSDLRSRLGFDCEQFFIRLSDFIVEESERNQFLNTYLGQPAREAFARGENEKCQSCFIRIPGESEGRHVQFKMNMVKDPFTGDVVGILTVTDITEQTIEDQILHRLSITGYDFVVDVDLFRDRYRILSGNDNIHCRPPSSGSHSEWVAKMAQSGVVPRDREAYLNALDPAQIPARLEKQGSYTFAFSVTDDDGDIRMMNMTVSAIDLRIGRICLLRTDITDSIREQQGLLNMLAYTFEVACFLDLNSCRMTMYTRETVMKNLPPHCVSDYDRAIEQYLTRFVADDKQRQVFEKFRTANLLARLEQEPSGYDFLFTRKTEEGPRYKRANVMWGDMNHKTICLVRADVTDMLEAELESKRKLEHALMLAEHANRAKSSFLSSMSHDIRTPMNAVMGMTTLALAHLDEPDTVRDYLQKITASSRHLLNLINDILDMSKIEHEKIVLTRAKISLSELIQQVLDILVPQMKTAGLHFSVSAYPVQHEYFYGDLLHINQILINILGNAVKFTPAGGRIEFGVREMDSPKGPAWAKYCFTIRDTGIGMSKAFQRQIFEPFSRSTESIQQCVEGTGLGLSIVKGLVDQMGGVIEVESVPDEGSTFRVALELEWIDEPQPEFKHKISPVLLAVGDETESARIGGILSMAGITVCPPDQGLQKDSARLVLTDGSGLAKADPSLRKRLLHLPVPVLYLTDYEMQQEKARENGIRFFMAKPFLMSAFYAALKEIEGNDRKETAAPDAYSLDGRRFLVAEDNLINAEILKGLMNLCGAGVDVRADGIKTAEAFEKAPGGTYDAILMDIQMPNMNGYEATRLIRAMNRPDAKTIPIVAMTANAFTEDIKASREAGMNAHIAKPIDLNILKETLGKILSGN